MLFDDLNLPDDMANTLKIIYERAKKYDHHLSEQRFLQAIISQWLDIYVKTNSVKLRHKDQVTLCNDLKAAIHQSGKTQRQIAQETGINYTYLSQIIHGKYEPSVTMALLLMEALNYPPARIKDLFYLEPVP